MRFLHVSFIQFFRHVRHTFFAQISAFFTISLVILVYAFFYLLYQNASQIGFKFNEEIKVRVYFSEELEGPMQERISQKIKDFGNISKVVYISKKEAYDRLLQKIGTRRSILDGLPDNFLPSSFEVYPEKSMRELTTLDLLVKHLYSLPNAEKAEYGQQWLERFRQLVYITRVVVIASTLILAVTLSYVIAGTIRQMIASRRDELYYLTTLGTSPGLIRFPFVLEGFFQGAFGAGTSIAVLYGVYRFVLHALSSAKIDSAFHVSFLTTPDICVIVCSTICFCSIGAYLASREFMRDRLNLSTSRIFA